MSERETKPEDLSLAAALPPRRQWTQPTVVKLATADAELSTRAVGTDGAFSKS